MKCCRAESIDLETSHSPVVARRKRRATRDATHTTPARRRTRPRTNPRRMLPPLHTLVLYDQPQTVRRPRASLHRAENEHSFRSLRFASPRARVRPGRARVSSLRRRADASPPPIATQITTTKDKRIPVGADKSKARPRAARFARASRARSRSIWNGVLVSLARASSSSRRVARRARRRRFDDSTRPRRDARHFIAGPPARFLAPPPPARVSRAPSPIDR